MFSASNYPTAHALRGRTWLLRTSRTSPVGIGWFHVLPSIAWDELGDYLETCRCIPRRGVQTLAGGKRSAAPGLVALGPSPWAKEILQLHSLLPPLPGLEYEGL